MGLEEEMTVDRRSERSPNIITSPGRARRPRTAFLKEHLDELFSDLRRQWQGSPEYDSLSRDTHLGVALFDYSQRDLRYDERIRRGKGKLAPIGIQAVQGPVASLDR